MEQSTDRPKVQRSRKRIYETVPEETTVTDLPGSGTEAEAAAAIAAEPAVAAEPERAAEPVTDDDRQTRALQLVRTWSAWASGVGLVPLPAVDMVAVTGLQVAMLRKLADLYEVPFSEQRSKTAVGALVGGVNAGLLGGSMLKALPFLGIFSLLAMPAVNGALTYAVGKVFIQHFASGGTFLDFDPATVRAYFEEQYRQGKLKTQ